MAIRRMRTSDQKPAAMFYGTHPSATNPSPPDMPPDQPADFHRWDCSAVNAGCCSDQQSSVPLLSVSGDLHNKTAILPPCTSTVASIKRTPSGTDRRGNGSARCSSSSLYAVPWLNGADRVVDIGVHHRFQNLFTAGSLILFFCRQQFKISCSCV